MHFSTALFCFTVPYSNICLPEGGDYTDGIQYGGGAGGGDQIPTKSYASPMRIILYDTVNILPNARKKNAQHDLLGNKLPERAHIPPMTTSTKRKILKKYIQKRIKSSPLEVMNMNTY